MEYKAARDTLTKAMREAKRHYKGKLGGIYSIDSRWMRQGLNHTADYRTTANMINSKFSLLDDLNIFYICFDSSRTERKHTPSLTAPPPLMVSP